MTEQTKPESTSKKKKVAVVPEVKSEELTAESVTQEKPVIAEKKVKKAASSSSKSLKTSISKPKATSITKSKKSTQTKSKLSTKITEDFIYSTGKRKEAVAKVWIAKKQGTSVCNGKSLEEYFSSSPVFMKNVQKPLVALGDSISEYCIVAQVLGGGISGQSQALALGIAKALALMDESRRFILRSSGLLTRDSRTVEPKKTGLRKARRRPQFSKR